MDVAVTGAAGHVGGNLVRALLEEGRSVRVLVRNDTRAIDGLDVEIVRGDVLDPAALKKLFRGVRTAYHAAGKISIMTSHDAEVLRTNIEGARNVAEACLACGVGRLVHFSSIHAFCSDPGGEMITEERELVSRSDFCYDRSKAAGQREVLKGVARGLDAVIVNPTGIIGPIDYKPSRMGETLLDIYHSRLPALIDGGYNWVDVRDVVQGAIAAERKGRTGECYLLAGHWKSIADIAETVTAVSGIRTPRLVTPLWLCAGVSHVSQLYSKVTNTSAKFTPYAIKTLRRHRHISHSKAGKELGYRPRPFEETIRDTLMWFDGIPDPGSVARAVNRAAGGTVLSRR